MKLITEANFSEVKYLSEGENGEKTYYIEGIFMQADQKNRNGRVYPRTTLMNECNRFINEKVRTNRAVGELGHPDGPTVNPERASHIIKELRISGNDIIGRAKIMDTPYGNIVKNFIKEGISLGVSSRGLGTLVEKNGYKEVQEDFHLATVDIVTDPSAPGAFVQGIMENREWILEGGAFKAIEIENAQRIMERSGPKNFGKNELRIFEAFMKKLASTRNA